MKKFFLLLLVFTASSSAIANNIAISNVALGAPNVSEHYRLVKLTLTWENSWRTYNLESNYDAAWIFIKFKRSGENEWRHATINFIDGKGINDGHIAPANCEINTSSDRKGVFVFRANSTPLNFIGNANYPDIQLRWNYGVDALGDADPVEIAISGIEMVYVPQAGFYVGDGSVTPRSGYRLQDGSTTNPFYLGSEGQLTLGGTTSGSLSRPQGNASGNGLNDDFNQITTQVLPGAFPKGFKAFYCMKYEISQEQYASFLKKLLPAQSARRYAAAFYGRFRFTIDSNFIAGAPDRACGFISWQDAAAYADWAGLRPMSELEYEKACRGPLASVAGEFAWGNTTIRRLVTINLDGTSAETDNDSPRANAHFVQGTGNANSTNPLYGPMRVGWTSGGSRESAGDTYYGISDMSGNTDEQTVGIGVPANRNFTGSHGDGVVSSAGDATNADWPGFDSASGTVSGVAFILYRGGSIFGSNSTNPSPDRLRTSYRSLNYREEGVDRFPFYGFRAVRSAE